VNLRLAIFIAIIAILLFAIAYGVKTAFGIAASDPATYDAANSDSAGTREFTDSAGRTVILPENITRIAPSGQLAQIFLLAIAPDLLVTKSYDYTGDNAKYVPDYIADLPNVGQFYGKGDFNAEEVARLNPQVVIDCGDPKDTIADDMDGITEKTAIPAIHITGKLDTSAEAFRTLGKLLGREEKGEQLARYIEKILALGDEILAKIPEKARAIYVNDSEGTIYAIMRGSIHADVFDYIADNAAVADSGVEIASSGAGNEVNFETIAEWNPDVIFFASGGGYENASASKTWGSLDAVKNGDYYEVPYGPYNWFGLPPSIQRYLFLIWAAKILYPEQADYDLQELVTEYYKLFYDYDLTDEGYAELVGNGIK